MITKALGRARAKKAELTGAEAKCIQRVQFFDDLLNAQGDFSDSVVEKEGGVAGETEFDEEAAAEEDPQVCLYSGGWKCRRRWCVFWCLY